MEDRKQMYKLVQRDLTLNEINLLFKEVLHLEIDDRLLNGLSKPLADLFRKVEHRG